MFEHCSSLVHGPASLISSLKALHCNAYGLPRVSGERGLSAPELCRKKTPNQSEALYMVGFLALVVVVSYVFAAVTLVLAFGATDINSSCLV